MTRQFFLLFAVFAIALILWKFFLPDIFFKRVFEPAMRGNISDTGTFDDRLFLIKEAIRLANQTVWLGFGVEQHASHSVLGASVHNVYLLTLTEGGILSLLGLAGFFCASLFVVWSGYVFYGRSEDTAVSLVLVLMVFLVFSAITYFYARFWALPWMLGLSASLSRDLTTFQAHKTSPGPERLRAALRRPS